MVKYYTTDSTRITLSWHIPTLFYCLLKYILNDIIKASISEFQATYKPSDPRGLTSDGKDNRNYLAVYELMPHIEDMPTEDLIQYAMVKLNINILLYEYMKKPEYTCIQEMFIYAICS